MSATPSSTPSNLAPQASATPDAAALLLDGLTADEQGSRLGDPTKAYLASLTSERSRQTACERLRAAARVIGLDPAAAEDFPWHRLRFQHIDFIRSRLSEKDPATDKRRAPATINLTLSILRGIARYARNMNLMSDEEYRRIGEVKPAIGEHLPVGRAAASSEILALVKACQADHGPAGARDAAMLAILYVGGVRRAELAGLDVAHYMRAPAGLKVHGKGNKERLVPLTGSATAALDDWLAVRGATPGPLFVRLTKGGHVTGARLASHAVYKILRKRLAQAGVEDLRPHDFRRTFIGDLLQAKVDLATVQQMAGHASPLTTVRYDRRGDEARREAVEHLHFPYTRRGKP
jgi:site-specific recombinase XerD